MKAKTFREAYAVLSGHAETLRDQTEPNIDELLAIVTESVAAYKLCQTRIDAVDKALKEALRDVDDAGERAAQDERAPGPSPRPARAGRPAPDARDDDYLPDGDLTDDDDPPF